MTIDFAALAAEFPRDAVSWRCQTVSKNGDKGLALAYIDARDVMRRLDEVCGPAGWQDRYEVHGGKTICYLSIKIADEMSRPAWIAKADGSGDSDIEEEKGAISGAFKRAAVKWGIGRYLYDVPAPWVPCKSYDKGEKNGRKLWGWSEWAADPWQFVRQPAPAHQEAPRQQPKPGAVSKAVYTALEDYITNAESMEALSAVLKNHDEAIHSLPEEQQADLRKVYAVKREALRVFA